MGPGAARNRALAEARGEFFIPVDADNVPIRAMVERFVEGMLRNPDLSVLTCFLKAFNHEEGVGADVAEFVYMPTGGPFVVSCFENVYGDTNAIFRTQHFREAGGFEIDPDTFIEDWETFVKLVAAGLKLDVIPDVLFNYRLRGDNRSLAMSRDRADMYPFVQRMIRRRFVPLQELHPLDTEMLWLGIAAFGNHKVHRAGRSSSQPTPEGWPVPSLALRYRFADRVNSYLKWIAPLHKICRSMIDFALRDSSRRQPAPPAAASTAENFAAPAGGIRVLGLPWPNTPDRGTATAA
jgi:glycosyltransferase involved in cell wall biosynthesis